MSKTWIQVYPSGTAFDLLAPRAADVHPGDIAHHLSQLNRFTGGTRVPYSVAEHCVRVSLAVENHGGSTLNNNYEVSQLALAGLLHDAAEAYVGDLSAPAKQALRALQTDHDYDAGAPGSWRCRYSLYDDLEERIQYAVAERFAATYPWHGIVHHFDLVLLATEKRDLLGPAPQPWALPPDIAPLEARIEPWPATVAARRWLDRLSQLGGA